ncbi:MAG: GEVED domain-containing protein, partial [Flavobacteriales bacterium]
MNIGYAATGIPNFTFNPYDFNGSITFINVTPCSGTPNPGNTLSDVNGACVGQPIALSLQNNIIGSGVTYSWEFDNGGGWTPFGGGLATQTATQSIATSYRCVVTCTEPGGGNQTSNVVTIPMAGPYPVEFSQALFPSNCWTRSGTAATFVGRDNANGFGMSGTGSAKWDFWNAAAATTQIITSPDFTALTGSKQVTFDVAGAKWTDAAIDQIALEYSTTGNAGPWSNISVMTNALGGDLNTAGEVAALFVPTAGQWVRRSYPVPAGANAIRFIGVAGFGNNVYIDNITIEDALACATPAGVASNLVGTTAADINWTLTAASSYNVEVRSSGAPGSGPAGLEASGNVAAPPFNAIGLTFGQTYIAYVQGDCGIDGLSHWSAPHVFAVNYCAAGANNTNPANIGTVSNVQIAGINQNNASIAGYVDFTAATGSMAPGGNYAFLFTRSNNYPNDQFIVWVDWNGDLDWNDPGEDVFTSPVSIGAGPYGGFIACPPGTAPGTKRMRLRRQYVDVGAGFLPNNTPCGNSTFGQVLDFTIDVCGPAVATASVTDDCNASTFSIDVNIASNPGGALTINWVATPGGPGSMPASLGLNTIPVAFASNAEVNVTIDNGTLCTTDLGNHYSNCPITIACGNTITISHCYRDSDPRTFTFLSSIPGETVTLSFISGTMDPNDVIRGYSGTDNAGTPIVELTGSFANLGSPTVTGTSTGNALFLEIDSDGGNSCYNGGAQSTWVFEVECTPGCVDPDGTVTENVNCLAANFTLDVEVNFTGDGATVNLLHSVNSVPQPPITGLVDFDIETLGPFAIGT